MNALVNPTVRQIIAQVDAILRHDPAARVIGIRSQAGGDWPAEVRVGDRDFAVAWCPSPIAVREQLVALAGGAGGEEAGGLVVMTPLSDHDLGIDVLSRLARGKVFAVESWEMVRHAFQAREIDARLARWPWVAEALLDHLPPSGYPPARGGVLDADTAWFHALRSVLGLTAEQGGRPDLNSVLRWTLAPDAVRRFDALSERARRQVGQWLGEVLGSAGGLVVRVLEAGYGGELMPLALVMGMVFRGGAAPSRELLTAGVRLERFTGGAPVVPRDALRLHAAAAQVARAMDPSGLMPVLDLGDRMAEALQLADHAWLSDDLPSGFNGRLQRYADALGEFLSAAEDSARRGAALQAVLAAGRQARDHQLAGLYPVRIRRLEMSMRLCRWLEKDASAQRQGSRGVSEGLHAYSGEGAFVDWARLALIGGDELGDLSRAYAGLRDAARTRRDDMNRRFAEDLAAWNGAGCPRLPDVLPVESIVADWVAPLAAQVPVLLLVVDGLSFPVFRELLDDAQRQGWSEMLPAGSARAPVALAAIPSVTEISRTSLFIGKLAAGQAQNEKSGFAAHPALAPLAGNRSNARPLVLHKADLSSGEDAGSLAASAREAIGSRERRVVAVVFNGVDDHLSGSDQLVQRWSLDDLRLVKPLLYEARNAGRLVIVTADHGHVIDEATRPAAEADQIAVGSGRGAKSSGASDGGGDRWRTADSGTAGEGEMLLAGGRVKAPGGASQVIVAWSETVRRGARKNGYHGGVSLQEMAVPLALLAPSAMVPDGLVHAPAMLPDWWELVIPDAPAAAAPPAKPRPKARGPAHAEAQGALFDLVAPGAPAGAPTPEAAPAAWVQSLLGSAVYLAQKQWVARAAVRDEEMARLLAALEERGGRISKAALAGRLGLPLLRVSGFINAARRLLNVDQSPVLSLDETEGAVTLNRALLEVQFQVGNGATGRPR